MARTVYPEALDISRDCEIIDVKLVICTYLLAKVQSSRSHDECVAILRDDFFRLVEQCRSGLTFYYQERRVRYYFFDYINTTVLLENTPLIIYSYEAASRTRVVHYPCS